MPEARQKLVGLDGLVVEPEADNYEACRMIHNFLFEAEQFEGGRITLKECPTYEATCAASPEVQKAVILAGMERSIRILESWKSPHCDVYTYGNDECDRRKKLDRFVSQLLSRKQLRYSADDLRAAYGLLKDIKVAVPRLPLDLLHAKLLATVEAEGLSDGLREDLVWLIDVLEHRGGETRRTLQLYRAVLFEALASAPGDVTPRSERPAGVPGLHPGSAVWSDQALADLPEMPDAAKWVSLLTHAGAVKGSGVPARKWLSAAEAWSGAITTSLLPEARTDRLERGRLHLDRDATRMRLLLPFMIPGVSRRISAADLMAAWLHGARRRRSHRGALREYSPARP